ncbi:MAG: nucleoside recognition protein [Thermoleophilia bacterium]|nr:nucleoside recognition protein [Thermoleophilia bacterium]
MTETRHGDTGEEGRGPEPGAAVAAPGSGPLRADVRRGLRAGLVTFWDLIKMMVPAYFVALLLERLGVIDVLAEGAEPVMSVLGLPGEAAVPLVVGYVLNIYAAIGAMQALALTAQQITVLAIAVLIGHNLLVEGVVLQRAGMNGVAFGVLRIVAGLAAAGVANLLMGVF